MAAEDLAEKPDANSKPQSQETGIPNTSSGASTDLSEDGEFVRPDWLTKASSFDDDAALIQGSTNSVMGTSSAPFSTQALDDSSTQADKKLLSQDNPKTSSE